MYIATVPNRNSPPAVLLREGWREGNKTRQRTLANLSDWPKEKIETFRRLLRDEPLVSPHDLFATQKSLPHGHVQAVLEMIGKLGLDRLISAQRCRERDLVVAMIVQRLIAACSKLATTREWHTTTLAEELGVAEATENDLYEAMDWLFARQERIEKKLAARHLHEVGLVLYDVSSSFYEGRTCPLAQFGHDPDGKNGLPIIVYGGDDEWRRMSRGGECLCREHRRRKSPHRYRNDVRARRRQVLHQRPVTLSRSRRLGFHDRALARVAEWL
jgi:hypothetical protein